ARVDDTVEGFVVEGVQKLHGLPVNGVVVVEQQLARSPHRVDLVRRMTIAGVALGQWEVETADKPMGLPDLFQAGGGADLRILYPAKVPDQPRNRVSVG